MRALAASMVVLALGAALAGCHGRRETDDDDRSEAGGAARSEARGRGAHLGGDVTLSAAAMRHLGVRVAPALAGTLAGAVVAPAEVQLDPDRVVRVSSLLAGQIVKVSVSLGQRVKAGQALAVLRSTRRGEARARLACAVAAARAARAEAARSRKLYQEGIVSDRRRLDAELARRRTDAEVSAARASLLAYGLSGGRGPDMALRSPIAGEVIARTATRGETVQAGRTLFTVADASRLWVMGQVAERDVGRLRAGMSATLTVRALSGRTFEGRIDYVALRLDEKTRTLPVRVQLDNSEGLLRAGLFGSLTITTSRTLKSGGDVKDNSHGQGRKDNSHAQGSSNSHAQGRSNSHGGMVVLPADAVVEIWGRSVVFVTGASARTFRPVPVVTGARAAGQVEVVSGLVPGQRVVVRGAFILKSQVLRPEGEEAE